jgi:HK97 family phage major capsid protein
MPEEPTPAPEPIPDPEPKPAEAKPEIDWKAEARKHEQRAKENAAAAAELAALKESQKTEAQKLADRVAQAEKERDDARIDALRVKVGAAKKLPADVVELLRATRKKSWRRTPTGSLSTSSRQHARPAPRPGAARLCTTRWSCSGLRGLHQQADEPSRLTSARLTTAARAAPNPLRRTRNGTNPQLHQQRPAAPTITGPIFAKASESSAVQQLARRVPLSINANTAIPVPLDVPVADWVGEAGVKVVSENAVGVKQMTGKKVAVLIPVSEEVMRTNPGGAYDQVINDAPTALARAFDYASINGKSLRTGSAGPFAEYLAQTPNSVALGTAAASAGGLYNDLMTGVGKVIDNNYDFTGFAADKRLLVDAALSTDTQGRPIFIGQDSAVNAALGTTSGQGTIAGLPAAFSQGVSGRYWRQGDNVQTVTISGTPTGGTFTLSSGGNTTTALAYNAAAATVQTAIRAFGTIWAAVTVTGSAGGPYTITYPNATSNVAAASAPFTADITLLTGGTPAVVVARPARAVSTRTSAPSAATGPRPPTASAWTSSCGSARRRRTSTARTGTPRFRRT